jgi:hypothetical protein
MSEFALFLVVWLALCSLVPCGMLIVMNLDRIVVFVLREIETPLFREAWTIADLICRYPEQWEVEGRALKHAKIGRVQHSSGALGLSVSGPFGEWRPNFIERRIIWDAIAWRQRASLMQAMKS